MPTTSYDQFTQLELTPAIYEERLAKLVLPVAANQVIPRGGVVAQTTAASATDVQTLTGTATGGTFTITFGNATQYITSALPFNATAAQIQAALQALPNIGAGGVVCSGGALGTSPVVCTFAGALANQPQPLFVINNGGATGGSVTVAHTTQGVANGALVNYDGTKVANPTVAPSVSAAGADGTLAVGAYSVTYTYVTAAGESLPSPAATIAVASTNHITIASITSVPANVTSVNVYLNGTFYKNQTVTANATGAFNILAPAAGAGLESPNVSTAYNYSDGRQIPIGLAILPMAADPSGKITFASTPTGNSQGQIRYAAEIAIAGYFNTGDLAGLDANVVSILGRLVIGTTSAGILAVTGV